MLIEVTTLDESRKRGVYLITNLENNKIYVGSTTNSFKERWMTHIQKLRSNKHPNQHLQSSFNKYGENKFKFSILEVQTNIQTILEREQYYLDFYKSYDRNIGYNIEKDVYKREVSEETKAKISETLKSKYKSGEIQKKFGCEIAGWNKGIKCPQISKTRREMFDSIEVYDKNMTLMCTFRSVTDLCEWSETNTMPRLKMDGRNKKGGLLRKDKIYLSIRQDSPYKGLYFKKVRPLSPEMGIVKWENCVEGEIPDTQPSLSSTPKEGSETNS